MTNEHYSPDNICDIPDRFVKFAARVKRHAKKVVFYLLHGFGSFFCFHSDD